MTECPYCERLRAERNEAIKNAAYHSDCRPNRRQAEAWRDLAKTTNDQMADEIKAHREAREQLAALRAALLALRDEMQADRYHVDDVKWAERLTVILEGK